MECKHTVKLVVDVLQQVCRRGHRQVIIAGSRPHKCPAAANMPRLRVQGSPYTVYTAHPLYEL